MSVWFYYDSDGQKQGPITGGRLKGLAKAGLITPGTMVQTEDGKAAPARRVKGLTFAGSASSDELTTFDFPCPHCNSTLQAKKSSVGKMKQCPTCGESFTVPDASVAVLPPPVKTETYGLTAPPLEPNPFSASMPEPVDMPIAAPFDVGDPFAALLKEAMDSPTTTSPESENPFTAPMSAAVKPAAKTLEVFHRFGAVPSADNLFCTECGSPISAQAVACMSCGVMNPVGHKKFCRQCGVALNPAQVVCVKCGASLARACWYYDNMGCLGKCLARISS
jgi:hypothetical protein